MDNKDYSFEIVISILSLWILMIIYFRIKNIKIYGRCGSFNYHCYETPIISRYLSFGARRIIYECRCGKRKSYLIYRNFDDPFPIKTHSVSFSDFEEIKNGANYKIIGELVFLEKDLKTTIKKQ